MFLSVNRWNNYFVDLQIQPCAESFPLKYGKTRHKISVYRLLIFFYKANILINTESSQVCLPTKICRSLYRKLPKADFDVVRYISAPVLAMMLVLYIGSPFLVNVTGSGEVINGTSPELQTQQLNVHELSHIGRDCQLTLKLPGLTAHTLAAERTQSTRYKKVKEA